MTTGPVNLNKFRKQKQRVARKAKADENAAKFGQTRAVKSLDHARAEKARRDIDLHKRDKT